MTIPRFNGIERWAALTPEQQAAVGAIALEYAACFIAADESENDIVARAAAANDFHVANKLLESVRGALPNTLFCDMVPSLVGQVCRECGCTEEDACPGGCSWVAEDLCSACAP